MAVKEIQESHIQEHIELANLGVAGIRKMITGEEKGSAHFFKACDWAASRHPYGAHNIPKETVTQDAPQDTQSLNKFFEMHAKKKRQAEAYNAKFSVTEDIDVSGEIEHTTPQDVEESVDD
jgi:hypothetical protein